MDWAWASRGKRSAGIVARIVAPNRNAKIHLVMNFPPWFEATSSLMLHQMRSPHHAGANLSVPLSERQFRRAHPRSGKRRHGGDRRAGGGAGRGRAQKDRLAAQ